MYLYRSRVRMCRTSTSVPTNARYRERGPPGLDAREVAVEARDRDEADAVEQRRDGKERRVGSRCESSHCEVRDEVEAEHHREEDPEVRRQVGLLREQQEDVATGDDDDGHQAEPEFVRAPAPPSGRAGDRAGEGGGAHGPAGGAVAAVGAVVVVLVLVVGVVDGGSVVVVAAVARSSICRT